MLGLLLAVATAGACRQEPAEIRIKGPHNTIEATAKTPHFEPFEKKGDTLQLRASSFDKRGTYLGTVDVAWDSSDRSVATVSQSGLITILSSGDFVISARFPASGSSSDARLKAELPLSAVIEKSIRIVEPKASGRSTLNLPLGETFVAKAEVLDDRGRVIADAKILWSSTSFAATVATNGEVEGRAIGTTQVIAESLGGHIARLDVNVVDWSPTRGARRERGKRSSG